MQRSQVELSDLSQPLLEQKEAVVDIQDNEYILEDLKEAEKKLNLCIALLRSQYWKKRTMARAPRLAGYAVTLGPLLGAVGHLIASYTKFRLAFSQFDSTMHTSASSQVDCNKLIDLSRESWFFLGFFHDTECREKADYALRSHYEDCASAIQTICDGPGMDIGYVPFIIIFGMLFPAFFALAISVVPLSAREKGQFTLNEIPAEKAETIRRYANKYQVSTPENATLLDLIDAFKNKHQEIQAARDGYLGQCAFVMGSREKTAPISLLFNSAARSDATNLARMIFDYAGSYMGAAENTRLLNALMDGSHSKNSKYRIQLLDHRPTDGEVEPFRLYVYEIAESSEGALKNNRGEIERVTFADSLQAEIKTVFIHRRYWSAEVVTLNENQENAFNDFMYAKGYSDGKLYTFFNKLNAKDSNNDAIYEKEKIISKIVKYAKHENIFKRNR